MAALSGGPPVPWWFRDLLRSGSLFQPGALGLGSSRTRIPPLSISGQFLRSWLLDSTREAGRGNGHIPQAWRLGWGPSGSSPRNISHPFPGERHSRVGRCPSHPCPGLGSEGRSRCCLSSGRNGFVSPVIVVSNAIITILF